MKKGYFPHLANTPANQNYVGTYFPAEMYIPGQMSEKDRAKFYQWYNAKKDSGAIFDFRREMGILSQRCGYSQIRMCLLQKDIDRHWLS